MRAWPCLIFHLCETTVLTQFCVVNLKKCYFNETPIGTWRSRRSLLSTLRLRVMTQLWRQRSLSMSLIPVFSSPLAALLSRLESCLTFHLNYNIPPKVLSVRCCAGYCYSWSRVSCIPFHCVNKLSLSFSCFPLQPGGSIFFTTINKTAQSYALAVVGAERLVGLVEPGTHDWSKFIAPEELESLLQQSKQRRHVTHGSVL